jgi:EAL domain-containing protein (putative c-di-GMP-specific phosphodiesterase class I)
MPPAGLADIIYVLTAIPPPPSDTGQGGLTKKSVDLPPFTMAFQPIVNVLTRQVFAYEALVRGPQGESAASVLDPFRSSDLRYHLDRNCRIRAIQMAAALGIAAQGAKVSINLMPASTFSPESAIHSTLQTAASVDFPVDALIFEILEDEKIEDIPHLSDLVDQYHANGFNLALDDFGSGYSGLTRLSKVSADIVKLDASLVRDIHLCPRSRCVLAHTVAMCRELDLMVVGEAVETLPEYEALLECGVTIMQGFLFARPGFEHLPAIHWPETSAEPLGAASRNTTPPHIEMSLASL